MQASNIDWILKKHQNSTYNNRDATGANDTQALKSKPYHSMTNCLNELSL